MVGFAGTRGSAQIVYLWATEGEQPIQRRIPQIGRLLKKMKTEEKSMAAVWL